MFHDIPQPIMDRMRYLEEIDSRDRNDGTPRMARLRQIPPDTGRFIALLAASAPEGDWIEVGTSAGYSTLWLALACRATGRRLTTFEILPEKAELARETFRLTGVSDVISLVEGDALDYIPKLDKISFCFLDAEKEVYADCYDAVIPRLVKGGLIIADNAINHRETLQPMLDRALCDDRVDGLIVPIGKGELVCRKL
ncbi:MAG: O-methyltransferase [Armatimonadota bacterium]